MRRIIHLALIFLLLGTVVPAAASDSTLCGAKAWPTDRIAACSRLLEAPATDDTTARHVVYNNRASAYFALGRYDEAIADGDAALVARPDYPLAFNNRGNAWLGKGDLQRALADFDAAIRLDPWFAEAFYNRGNAYLSRGKLAEALADFSKAIERDGQHFGALNNRGIIHERMGNRAAALDDYRKALALVPESPSVAANVRRLREAH